MLLSIEIKLKHLQRLKPKTQIGPDLVRSITCLGLIRKLDVVELLWS